MIYPPDMSKEAVNDRGDLGFPDPDFEVDVELFGDVKVDVRAEVIVEVMENGGATLALHLKASSLPEEFESDGSGHYSIFLKTLNELPHQPPRSHDMRDWPMRLPKSSREGMLIWWDEHQAEIQAAFDAGYDYSADSDTLPPHEAAHDNGTPWEIAEQWVFSEGDGYLEGGTLTEAFEELTEKLSLPASSVRNHLFQGWASELAEQIQRARTERPDENEVERQLRTAGLRFRRGGLDANWNTAVWNLGGELVPRSAGALFLVDSEDEIRGISQFALVLRRSESADELGSGSLQKMIALALDQR